MPTNHTHNPSIALSRLALQLDEVVQDALVHKPFDDTGISLAAAMLASSVERLEQALYLQDCLTRRSPTELALPRHHAPALAEAA